MKQQTIGMVAALPEEAAPLLTAIGRCEKETLPRQTVYTGSFRGINLCLAISGMGPDRAADATRLLIDRSSPDLVINFGFAGALSPELPVGTVVRADRLLFFHDRLFSRQQMPPAAVAIIPSLNVQPALFVTTGKTVPKKRLAALLPDGDLPAIVEMETAAAAKAAGTAGISFCAVRAISDTLDDELGFSPDELCDNTMAVRYHRGLQTVIRKPWIIPQLLRLHRQSRLAAHNLSAVILQILSQLADRQ